MSRIEGASGNDRLVGTSNDDEMYGFAGDDTLIASLGNDQFYGGDGIDTITYEADFLRQFGNLYINSLTDYFGDSSLLSIAINNTKFDALIKETSTNPADIERIEIYADELLPIGWTVSGVN